MIVRSNSIDWIGDENQAEAHKDDLLNSPGCRDPRPRVVSAAPKSSF